MTWQRKDTPESRAFWAHVERVAQQEREAAPGWALCVRCGERYDRHLTRYNCNLVVQAAQEDARG